MAMQRSKVLIVDDVPANLLVLSKLLKKLSVDVYEAGSAKEALKRLLYDDFAVMLVDVQMPAMDGYEFAELIRKEPSTRTIPIIFITANLLDEQYLFRGYEVGAVDYICKPFNEEILLNKIRVFIELHDAKTKALDLGKQNQLILNTAGEGICGLDSQGKIRFANPAANTMLGTEITGTLFFDYLSGKGCDMRQECSARDMYATCLSGQTYREDDSIMIRSDGSVLQVAYTITPITDRKEESLASVVVFQDISKRKELEAELELMAKTDIVTGLANRALFQKNLDMAISRATRHDKMLAVMFLDMDRFKSINDTLGHHNGDLLLKKFGERLVHSVRSADSIARIGGDEFTVIIEDIDEISNVLQVTQKIQANIKKPFSLEGKEVYVGASIGVSIFPWCGEDAQTLIKHADTAMYRAKERGRNMCEIFNAEMSAQLAQRVEMEHDLHRALEHKEFQLVYQPKVDLLSGKILGFEALLRWNHPKSGCISPSKFIALAEECKLIIPIGEWVINTACDQLNYLLNAGLPADFTFAVNLSSHQLAEHDFVNNILRITNSKHVDPRLLELELTESSIMKNVNQSMASLNKLHQLGFGISIDDFGTGYSSLNYLKKLPVQVLKIDKSFIKDITRNGNDAAIVKAIIAMAESLELTVIAEGVETKEQLTILKEFHCQQGQGFHFSKPLPLDHIPDVCTKKQGYLH